MYTPCWIWTIFPSSNEVSSVLQNIIFRSAVRSSLGQGKSCLWYAHFRSHPRPAQCMVVTKKIVNYSPTNLAALQYYSTTTSTTILLNNQQHYNTTQQPAALQYYSTTSSTTILLNNQQHYNNTQQPVLNHTLCAR